MKTLIPRKEKKKTAIYKSISFRIKLEEKAKKKKTAIYKSISIKERK